MASSQLLYTLLLVSCVLCGYAWGKAVDQELEERGLEGVQPEIQPKKNPCVYKGRVFTIDVQRASESVKGMNITTPDGKYVYFLSLCSPIKCAFGANHTGANATAAGCQYIINQQAFVELGKSANFEWHIVNTAYFYILYTGGDSYIDGQSRSLQVGFKQDSSCGRKPTLEFNGETINSGAHTYMFTVYLKMDNDQFLHLNEDAEI